MRQTHSAVRIFLNEVGKLQSVILHRPAETHNTSSKTDVVWGGRCCSLSSCLPYYSETLDSVSSLFFPILPSPVLLGIYFLYFHPRPTCIEQHLHTICVLIDACHVQGGAVVKVVCLQVSTHSDQQLRTR